MKFPSLSLQELQSSPHFFRSYFTRMMETISRIKTPVQDAVSTVLSLVIFEIEVDSLTRATKQTSVPISSFKRLFRSMRREERLNRMPPRYRKLYERIRKRRDKIGPLDFDILEMLQKIRGNDEKDSY